MKVGGLGRVRSEWTAPLFIVLIEAKFIMECIGLVKYRAMDEA